MDYFKEGQKGRREASKEKKTRITGGFGGSHIPGTYRILQIQVFSVPGHWHSRQES